MLADMAVAVHPDDERYRDLVGKQVRLPITGRLVRIDDFIVTLMLPDGERRTFRREGATPKVEVSDPLEPHRRIVLELTDRDMHNVTAYLASLRSR